MKALNTPRHQRRNIDPAVFLALAIATMPPFAARSAIAMADVQPLEDIRAAITTFIAKEYPSAENVQPEVVVGRLDPRLRLSRCEGMLEAFSPHGQKTSGNTTVGVRCNHGKPWTLYVPVTINGYTEVLTLATPLPKGTVLKKSDLAPIRHNIAALPHGYFSDPARLVGMELRRPMRAGEVVTPNAISTPAVVERGQQVILIAETGMIAVSMKAEALQDGSIGQRIQVRNLSSRRVVEAEVVSRNVVKVVL
jgi:flagella basal body P-ring formation protein FlgA